MKRAKEKWPQVRLFATAILILVVLAGCASGTRKALDDYFKAEPLPYYEKSIGLAEESPGEDMGTESPAMAEIRAEVAPDDKFLEIAASFFDTSSEELQGAFDDLKSDEQLDETLGAQLELNEFLYALAIHNPSVKSARHRWKATLKQYSQAEFLETLVSEYRTFTRYLDVQTGKPMNKAMAQQQYPFPSTISLKGELVREQVRLAEIEWQKSLRDAVVEAGKDYFDYQYLVRAEASTRENLMLVQGLVDVVERRYGAGESSQPDLLRVQTELERQRTMLEDLRSKQKAVRARINAALDRAPDANLGGPAGTDLPEVTDDVKALMEEALAHRQEVRMQRAKVNRIGIAIRLGEVMNRPLFSQGYSTFERGMKPEASEDESRVSYGLMSKSGDRPDYARAEAYLAEMRERHAATKADLDQVRARTKALAQTVFEQAMIAQRQVDLIDQVVLPQSQSAYETTLSAYTSDRMSFIDLLDAERALIRARLEEHASRRDLNQALLELARTRGLFSLPPQSAQEDGPPEH
ncbi:TolC family protein [bacterium]|nr:TolC family protein [bacterium]